MVAPIQASERSITSLLSFTQGRGRYRAWRARGSSWPLDLASL